MNLAYFVARDLHVGTCSELQFGRLALMEKNRVVDLVALLESTGFRMESVYSVRDLYIGTCSELQVGRLAGMEKVDLMAAMESNLDCI